MTAAAIKRSVAVGDVFEVTNHYITRPDHPCFGTRVDTVVRVNAAAITFKTGGRTRWPKAADLSVDGDAIVFRGHPHPGVLFLTLRRQGAS